VLAPEPGCSRRRMRRLAEKLAGYRGAGPLSEARVGRIAATTAELERRENTRIRRRRIARAHLGPWVPEKPKHIHDVEKLGPMEVLRSDFFATVNYLLLDFDISDLRWTVSVVPLYGDCVRKMGAG